MHGSIKYTKPLFQLLQRLDKSYLYSILYGVIVELSDEHVLFRWPENIWKF